MNRKGFTLVELILVIAIIAILASVILPRLQNARDQGEIARIRAEIEGFAKNGTSEEIQFGTYNVVCGQNGTATSTNLLRLVAALQSNSNNFQCNSTATTFAASVELETGRHWCVDSAGAKREISAPLLTGVTACP